MDTYTNPRETPDPARPAPVIGLFDSGVGGLSVMIRMLDVSNPPWKSIVYLADLAHFPYGSRPLEEVRRLAASGVDILARAGAGVTVVACNTAASSGVRAGNLSLAGRVLDIIGPGARHAAKVAHDSGSSTIIVLGTPGTIAGGVWDRQLRLAGHGGQIIGLSCPHLANLIEEGCDEEEIRRAVRDAVNRLPARPGGETVVLACTHYPFATEVIARVMADEGKRPARIVDPAQALVDELIIHLRGPAPGPEGDGRTAVERPVEMRFLTTGRRAHFERRAGQLINGRLAGIIPPLSMDRITETALAVADSG